jgi:hypothetical protein
LIDNLESGGFHMPKIAMIGAGIFFQVVDLDGNGKLDIVAAGKEGLYIFKNLGPEQVGVK